MTKVVRNIMNRAINKLERMTAWPESIRTNPHFPSAHTAEKPWDNPEYDSTSEVKDYFARRYLGEISVCETVSPDNIDHIDERDPLTRVNELISMYRSDGDLSDPSGERATYDSLVTHRDRLLQERSPSDS